MSDKAVKLWYQETSNIAWVDPDNFKTAKEEYSYFIINSIYENEKIYTDKKCYNK